jgi:hypothetical protein
VFRTEPPPNVGQLFLVDVGGTGSRGVFGFGLEVALEVVEETHLLFEFVGVVLEAVLLHDIFPLDAFDVEEEILAEGQHFCGIVEVDSDHVVAQCVPDSVFRRVVDPLLYRHVHALHLAN